MFNFSKLFYEKLLNNNNINKFFFNYLINNLNKLIQK